MDGFLRELRDAIDQFHNDLDAICFELRQIASAVQYVGDELRRGVFVKVDRP